MLHRHKMMACVRVHTKHNSTACCCLQVLLGGRVVRYSKLVVACSALLLLLSAVGVVLPANEHKNSLVLQTARSFVFKPGTLSYPLPPKNKRRNSPRAPERTDRAQSSTNVSGRVDLFSFLPKSDTIQQSTAAEKTNDPVQHAATT